MARSDSFFIRAELALDAAGTFDTTSIDLGSFVDALGKTVMRIHNISAQYVYGSNRAPLIAGANDEGVTQWQLTTQNQTTMVNASNRAVISTGSLVAAHASPVLNACTFLSQDIDVAPQHWENGFLVAVESLQLAGFNGAEFQQGCTVSIVLECTVETMTASASMALALSQQ